MSATALAAAAEKLEGVPFRFHGRDPATGLDCIGVLAAALREIGKHAPIPDAYSVRTRTMPDVTDIVRLCGFTPASGTPHAGDVIFVRLGPLQLHLLVAAGRERFVHAHAGLGRVVVGPMPDRSTIVGHWRFDALCQG